MTLQAINAQALRPAVNFKANEKAETSAATSVSDAPAKENEHTALKVLGGATALALLGFGIYKMVKGKGAPKAPKELQKLYPEYRNVNHKYEGNKIVEEIQAMQERLANHDSINVELNAMNWDATPIKRADFVTPNVQSISKPKEGNYIKDKVKEAIANQNAIADLKEKTQVFLQGIRG